MEQNELLDFLQLSPGEPRLVTKSELLAEVRRAGQPVTDRQLTFYVTEGLLPRSVRVGSRAGAYPISVVALLSWVLRLRDMGVTIEAIKELVPVWKYLIRARNDGRLDLGEFEYVARQHLKSLDAILAVPEMLTMTWTFCAEHGRGLAVIAKDGTEHPLTAPETTIGFAAAQRRVDDDGVEHSRWWGYRRITLAAPPEDYAADPTTVILGVRPNEALPPGNADGSVGPAARSAGEVEEQDPDRVG